MHRRRVVAGQQVGADIAGGLDPQLAGVRGLIEPGVVDCDAGGAGQREHQYLVGLGEGRPVCLLGQVEVAVHLIADPDGHAEEAAHRRMVRRKPDRRTDVVKDPSTRITLGDFISRAQHPVPGGKRADLLGGFGVDPLEHEPLQHRLVAQTRSRRRRRSGRSPNPLRCARWCAASSRVPVRTRRPASRRRDRRGRRGQTSLRRIVSAANRAAWVRPDRPSLVSSRDT